MTFSSSLCYAEDMKSLPGIILLLALVISGGAAAGADGLNLGTPRLAPALPPDLLQEPQQAVTSGSVSCDPGKEVCLAPLVGLDYRQRETTEPATALTRHGVNVRAGWRLSLFDALELSTTAKLPLLQAEQRQGIMNGDLRTGSTTRIRAAEQPLDPTHGLTWGSDVLLKLNSRFNLNLFYDYGKSPGAMQGPADRDERFGTRLEYKFK